jgi:hypothetical protein
MIERDVCSQGFDGETDSAIGLERLGSFQEEVDRRLAPWVRAIVVTPHPGNERWPGMAVLDPDMRVAERYGARAECVYAVRPDRYIGYRVQPLDPKHLLAYLDRLLDSPSASEARG